MCREADRRLSSWSEASTSDDPNLGVDDGRDGFPRGLHSTEADDPFVPLPNLPPDSHRIVTLRAVVVGCSCGALVNANNIYLGLKSGFSFSANIFGTIVGFAVCRTMARFGSNIPFIGGDFGPRENVILQTAAAGSGSLSQIFFGAFPAAYQLGLLEDPLRDYGRIVALTSAGAFFGLFATMPLRELFIKRIARELHLTFPSATACAMAIQNLHQADDRTERTAVRKMHALAGAMGAAALLRMVSQYAPGVLWEWHIFTWLYVWSNYQAEILLAFESWGWYLECSPAFVGAGIIVGPNLAFSFLGGSVLAWAIIGPILEWNGAAHSMRLTSDPDWSSYVSHTALNDEFAAADHPSARYWLMWPSVLCMIACSLTELLCQYKIIIAGARSMFGSAAGLWGFFHRPHVAYERLPTEQDESKPPPQHKSTAGLAWWMWIPGVVVSAMFSCLVAWNLFGMPLVECVLVLILSTFCSLFVLQCSGASDLSPLQVAAAASQVVLGNTAKNQGWQMIDAQRISVLGGVITSVSTEQANALVADFRTGFLLRTPPDLQFFVQGFATLVATFLAPGVYVLFSSAYPCINDLNAQQCEFGIPGVAAWRAMAIATTAPQLPIPKSSGIFAIAFSIVGSGAIVFRHVFLVGQREHIRHYWPNFSECTPDGCHRTPELTLRASGCCTGLCYPDNRPQHCHGPWSNTCTLLVKAQLVGLCRFWVPRGGGFAGRRGHGRCWQCDSADLRPLWRRLWT